MSPTQRTIAELRKRGVNSVAITEHWNHFAKIRQDLFGFIDILALVPDLERHRTLAIQTTTGAHSAERVRKIKDSPHFIPLLQTGTKVEVWSWSKRKTTGKLRWELKIVEVEP